MPHEISPLDRIQVSHGLRRWSRLRVGRCASSFRLNGAGRSIGWFGVGGRCRAAVGCGGRCGVSRGTRRSSRLRVGRRSSSFRLNGVGRSIGWFGVGGRRGGRWRVPGGRWCVTWGAAFVTASCRKVRVFLPIERCGTFDRMVPCGVAGAGGRRRGRQHAHQRACGARADPCTPDTGPRRPGGELPTSTLVGPRWRRDVRRPSGGPLATRRKLRSTRRSPRRWSGCPPSRARMAVPTHRRSHRASPSSSCRRPRGRCSSAPPRR